MTRPRVAAFAAVLAAVWLYDAARVRLPLLSIWGDVAVLATLLLPATFALVWLALPLRTRRGSLLAAGSTLGVLAWALSEGGFGIAANFAKLFAAAFVGWWFLAWFESVSWVVLVACIIPVVDSLSVWRGPTHHIITHRESVFTNLSVAFPVPGPDGAVRLGLPDVLFFALFLASAARFGMRVGWTWAALVVSLGATFALTVGWDVGGLPALPGIALGFLVANADLLWRHWRAHRAGQPAAE